MRSMASITITTGAKVQAVAPSDDSHSTGGGQQQPARGAAFAHADQARAASPT
jgi:hypothetical protein